MELTLNIKKKGYQKRQLKTILELHLLSLFGNGFHYQYIKVDCLKSFVGSFLFTLQELKLLQFLSSSKETMQVDFLGN